MTGTHKVLGVSLRILISAITFVVIGGTLAITINPVDFIRFSQDRQRTDDLKNLSQIITVMEVRIPESVLGETNIVYISLPDENPSCLKWIQKGLPALQKGFSYHCVPEHNYRNIDGTGWIPINFTLNKNISFSQLPIDPDNGGKGLDPDSGNQVLYFYQYVYGSTAFGANLASRQMVASMTHDTGGFVSEITKYFLRGGADSPLIQALNIAGAQMFSGDQEGIKHIIESQPGLRERIEESTRPIVELAVLHELEGLGEGARKKAAEILVSKIMNIFLPPASDNQVNNEAYQEALGDRENLLADPVTLDEIRDVLPAILQKIILADPQVPGAESEEPATTPTSSSQEPITNETSPSQPSAPSPQPSLERTSPPSPEQSGGQQGGFQEPSPPPAPSSQESSSVDNNQQEVVQNVTIPKSIRSASLGNDSKGNEMKFIPLTQEQVAGL